MANALASIVKGFMDDTTDAISNKVGPLMETFTRKTGDIVAQNAGDIDSTESDVTNSVQGVMKNGDSGLQPDDVHPDAAPVGPAGSGPGGTDPGDLAPPRAPGTGTGPGSGADPGTAPPVDTQGVGPCGKAGEPVDVVSGQYLTTNTDLYLPGVLPLILRRAYASGYRGGRLFGPGWSSTLDIRVQIDADAIRFADDDCRILDYPHPGPGQSVYPVAGERLPLTWDRERDEIRIQDPATGRTWHFTTLGATGATGATSDGGASGVQIRPLTAISDRNANRIVFERDDAGLATGVAHSGGYRVAVDTGYTAGGFRVEALRLLDGTNDSHGTTVLTYQYDPRGRLIALTDSTGVPFAYEHDADDRITAWIDRNGYRFGYTYDAAGRVVRTEGEGGYLSGAFAYDPGARVTTYTDSLGCATEHHYDEYGHVVKIVDPLGRTVETEQDAYGRVLSTTDGLGQTTRFTLDEHGSPVRVERPDGTGLGVAYNALRLPVSTVTPTGAVWAYAYDERGNCTAVTDPLGATTKYGYDHRGALTGRTDALGQATRIEPDAAGVPAAMVSGSGEQTRVERDGFGRVVASVDPLGAVTRMGWTTEGRPAWRVNADGTREQWTYDARGDVVEHRNAQGNTVRYEYGCFGLPVARTDPDGRRYEFGYDTECRIRTVTNPSGLCWNYEYDPSGRLAAETDFNGRTVAYRYDAAGRLAGREADGAPARSYVRDSLGRIVESRTGGETVRYAFDPAGRLVRAATATSDLSLTRDPVGRILTEAVDGRALHNEYDLLGSRIRRTTPAQTVSQWTYDLYGQPTAFAGTAGSLAFQYDAAGQETTRFLGAHAALTQTFDPMGRVTGQGIWAYQVDQGSAVLDPLGQLLAPAGAESAAASGAAEQAPEYVPLQQRTYAYRHDGHLVSARDALNGDRDFALDPFGRVATVTGATWTENYAYNEAGILASAEIPGASEYEDVLGPRTLSGTLLRQAARTAYEHDDRGRVVRIVRRTLSGQRLVREFGWNDLDQLVEARTPDGARWRYRYDPLGRRIGKRRVGDAGEVLQEVVFTWDGTRVAEEHVSSPGGGSSIRTWDYRPGTLLPVAQTERSAADTAGQGGVLDQREVDRRFYAIVTDLVGSPTELVAADGTIAWHRTASLWGLSLGGGSSSGSGSGADTGSAPGSPDCPLRFPGQYHDAETGWHYNFYRYYDPAVGRYVTADPLGLTPSPDDYGYVPNPCAAADPLGLASSATGPLAIMPPKPMLAISPPEFPREPPNIGPITARFGNPGDEFNMVLSAGQPADRPGAFATYDDIPSQQYARENLAIRSDWKPDVSTVQRYRISDGDPILLQESMVGPQDDPGLGRTLPGGAGQVEIMEYADRARLIPVGDRVTLPCT